MTRKQLVLCLETKAHAQPGERDRPRRGDPAALPTPRRENRGKDSGEKEGGSDIRAALPRGLRGYPHSDALHPIYVFRNAFLTCFFKKFQKIFRQMRDKYHYKAYVAFRMRENCTECRSDNSGSPIQYPIWPRPVSGRSYPPLPQEAASVWMHALILEHHGKLFQRQLYIRVLFKDLRQEETAGQNHRRSR